MRVTTLLRALLGLKHSRVLGFTFTETDLVVEVTARAAHVVLLRVRRSRAALRPTTPGSLAGLAYRTQPVKARPAEARRADERARGAGKARDRTFVGTAYLLWSAHRTHRLFDGLTRTSASCSPALP